MEPSREDRKKKKSRERIERYIQLMRRSNIFLLEEMKNCHHGDFGVTEEDAENMSKTFWTCASFYRAQLAVVAAVLVRGDAGFAKDLMDVGLQVSTSKEKPWMQTNVEVELQLKRGSTIFCNITFEEGARGNVKAVCREENWDLRRKSFFHLGQHHKVIDRSGQTQWEKVKSFAAAFRSGGLVFESEGQILVSNSNDHPTQTLHLQGTKHSRFCIIVNSIDRGSLALFLIMERSKEIATQVRVMASLLQCDCLHLFRTEVGERVCTPLKLTLGRSPETSWTWRPWVEGLLLSHIQDRPSSWWIRLRALYTMMTTCTAWEEGGNQLKVEFGAPV